MNQSSAQERTGRPTIIRHREFWAVRDPEGVLVCITVYKKGAREVARRLEKAAPRAPECGPAEQPRGGSDAGG